MGATMDHIAESIDRRETGRGLASGSHKKFIEPSKQVTLVRDDDLNCILHCHLLRAHIYQRRLTATRSAARTQRGCAAAPCSPPLFIFLTPVYHTTVWL